MNAGEKAGISADILMVDDDVINVKVAEKILKKNYRIAAAGSGREALEMLETFTPRLIMLDLHMPGMDGKEIMERLREREEWKKIPIIFLTADTDPEVENECLLLGAADFIVKPFVPAVMQARVERIMELYGLRNHLECRLAEKTRLVEKVSLNSIMAIANTVDAKDAYASGHSVRVAQYCDLIAGKLGWQENEVQNLHYIALLHDIGKIGVPDAVLNKPARLTEEEFEMIKRHPVTGNEILKEIHMIKNVAEGALYHHERYDGKGYPTGLAGEAIPLIARIISVADAYDAMTSNRVYRGRFEPEEVIREFQEGRGTQFDPVLADLFVSMIRNGEISFRSGGWNRALSWDSRDEMVGESSNLLNQVLMKYTRGNQNKVSTDPLTGLVSRSYAETRITALLKEGLAGVLFMMDMDNFKDVNDSMGHIMGDNVLKGMAETLTENAGPRDVVCRLGGDEFIMFLTGMRDRKKIAERSEEILCRVREKMKEIGCAHLTSVSMGIAVSPEDGRNWSTLYSNADKALYYIKRNGKNSFIFYSDGGVRNLKNETGMDLDNIRFLLEGRMNRNRGIFKVEYDEFKQLYSYFSRTVKRKGQQVQTLLFTLYTEENDLMDNDLFEKAMRNFEIAAASSLRMVDVGTRYSSMQYIVILVDTNLENGKKVAWRVIEKFYKIQDELPVKVFFDIQTMTPAALEEKTEEELLTERGDCRKDQ